MKEGIEEEVNNSIKKISLIADKWQKEMAKGYTKVVTIALLAIQEMHGYELVNLIKEKTFRFLNPSPSSIYPILSSLEEKGFIEGREKEVKGRHRKVYSITNRGAEILSEIISRQQIIQKSMRSLFDKLKEDLLDDLEIVRIPDEILIFDLKTLQKEKSKEEYIEDLKFRKGIILSRIKDLNDKLNKINRDLDKLENR
ncbi:MAG: hypothetical protein GF329_09950 [Candidatus Lokiarchaeota archaeon]|nr:hypothetical protein [Candidatus Lokiarchaeota archaeon]